MEFDLDDVAADGAVLYNNYANSATQPNRMALAARLQGVACAPLAGCRVLELGCANGGNLLPLAEVMPAATFVGIDRQPKQIQQAESLAAELEIENVEFRALEFCDVDDSLGKFDYVICHGVYCWVDADVQAQILKLCERVLTPVGLVHINLNVLPGSAQNALFRDYFRVTLDRSQPPRSRVAVGRAALELLRDAWASRAGDDVGGMLKAADALMSLDDGRLFHGYLDVDNSAIEFAQFLKQLDGSQLSYVAELEWSYLARQTGIGAWSDRIPADRLQRECVLDYLENRVTRHCLLRLNDHVPTENATIVDRIDDVYVICSPKRIEASNVIPAAAETFTNERGVSVTSKDPHVIAMLNWMQQQSQAATIGEIKDLVASISSVALQDSLEHEIVLLASGRFLDLSMSKPTYTRILPTSPRVGRFAQHQIRSTSKLTTSLRHEVLKLSELDQTVMLRLDGKQTSKSIAAELQKPEAEVSASLQRLAEASLLTG